MFKIKTQLIIISAIFFFFMWILNSTHIPMISPEYYEWLAANMRGGQFSVVWYFLRFPPLYIFGALLGLYIYVLLRGSPHIQCLGIIYILIFGILAMSPSIRYADIWKWYIVSESTPSIIWYRGRWYQYKDRMIQAGEKVSIIDFRINDNMVYSEPWYIPLLCTDDDRCFSPSDTRAQSESYGWTNDARHWWLRVFPN